jgi:uncharacterized protein (TIGR03032 family)
MSDEKKTPPMREVRFEYSPHFPEILKHCQASLLVSTYQAGKLGVLGVHDGKLDISFHSFEQAMGIAPGPMGIALGARQQIWYLQSAPELAGRIEPVGRHDACYLARQSHVTGNIHVHEMAWGSDRLWAVNTLFSTLCTVHEDFSFVARWKPPFITELAAEDRCHLNGMAMLDGAPRFVTAMSQTNTPAGWRPTKATSGIVMDVTTNEVVAQGLAMPHSPRWYADRLWVLDSGRGSLSVVDGNAKTVQSVATLPGYTRGLAFSGQFAFVGLSRVRETAIFGGLPVQQQFSELKCGIGIIDLQTGQNVAAFQFHSGVDEIFDVQVLPGIRNPVVCGPAASEDNAQTIWLVPPPAEVAKLDREGSRSVFNRADKSAQQSNSIMQKDPRAMLRQGVELHERGRLAEAVDAYRAALAINPNYADAYNNLGNVFQDLQQAENALECYRQAIRCEPNNVNAYRNLGYVLKEQGRISEGLSYLEQAQAIEPNNIIRYVLATSLPPVYESNEDLLMRRSQLETNVDAMLKDGLKIDVTATSAPTNFYSAYQGLNDRELQIKLASLLSAPQPLANRPAKKKSGKIRVGFISRHFRNHTIGRLNLGIVQNLPRDDFDVTVISVGSYDDVMAKAFAEGADKYVSTTTNLQEVRYRVSELDLDILYFADVGMDTLTYSLSMSRMAPVQCVTWGHPETTGSPVMDYFVSSKTLEIPEADEHYSEKLARFEVLNVYYYRPKPPEKKDHAYFGLDPKRNVYLCFQNLFKIHPDFDEVLNGILSRDPLGDIVMMEGRHPEWTEMLRNRWRRTLGSNMERIKFLAGQSHPDFMSLNALADVSLDPMHFGGGNTTYEALAVGLPVVTLPSKFLRARISNAMYQQMNMRDLIVESPEQYVDLALRLGTDKSYRQQMSTKILDHCGVLFEDQRAIAEFAKFFRSLPQG